MDDRRWKGPTVELREMGLGSAGQALRNRLNLLHMDCDSIGKLARVATLQAAAMHFATQGSHQGMKSPSATENKNGDHRTKTGATKQ